MRDLEHQVTLHPSSETIPTPDHQINNPVAPLENGPLQKLAAKAQTPPTATDSSPLLDVIRKTQVLDYAVVSQQVAELTKILLGNKPQEDIKWERYQQIPQ